MKDIIPIVGSILFAAVVAGAALQEQRPILVIDDEIAFTEAHMAQEHHMTKFDLQAFFHLHDLNRDQVLDVEELETIYGVHHEKLKKGNGATEQVHTERAKAIVDEVLKRLDQNGDRVLTLREFVEGGIRGLPNFKGIEHLGHHYDEEDEYFLHHEEEFHSTPDTMQPEAYIHPEDIEHFRHHDEIDDEEHRRLLHFTQNDDDVMEDGDDSPQSNAALQFDEDETERKERLRLATEQLDRLTNDLMEGRRRGSWADRQIKLLFSRPIDRADRLRPNTPYKYRMTSNWLGRNKKSGRK